jgi:hypothetical protein
MPALPGRPGRRSARPPGEEREIVEARARELHPLRAEHAPEDLEGLVRVAALGPGAEAEAAQLREGGVAAPSGGAVAAEEVVHHHAVGDGVEQAREPLGIAGQQRGHGDLGAHARGAELRERPSRP